MKLSQILAQVTSMDARATEALGEVSTKIADLQKQIEDLVASIGDPEVTDETSLAKLASLKATVDSLADIVPAPTPPVDPAPPVEEPVTPPTE